MKKITISKLFLYRYRFVIGYLFLGLVFIALLFSLPLFSQTGLSEAEMESATSSFYLEKDAVLNGDLINLPYRVLQKISISVLGLTPYAIKLPSIIIGLLLGLFLVLLLNRWFFSNVSLLASCLVVLSTPFLFLAGSGTPLIMLVFWPVLLFWLGSKIQGEKKPKPLYCFLFALVLLLAIFTPYMIYFAMFCILFVSLQPHLRFVVKSLPKIPLIVVGIIIVAGIGALLVNVVAHPNTIAELMFTENHNFLKNIVDGFTPVFAWTGAINNVFLAPLISLPTFALALTGLFSTTKGFFASRNSIASFLIVFTVIITSLNPDAAIFIILPLSILIAHGIKYLLEKWYGLFPKNPYARISGLIPLSLLFCIMIISSLSQYIYGYHYNPAVVKNFNYDLAIIRKNLNDEILIVRENYDFYKILEKSTSLKVQEKISERGDGNIAILRGQNSDENYRLLKIFTSPISEKSDIIYLYTEKGE